MWPDVGKRGHLLELMRAFEPVVRTARRVTVLDDDDAMARILRDVNRFVHVYDDYFLRAAEFRAWLREARDLYLDDLGSDEARRHFRSFVERWNAGKLGAYDLAKLGGGVAPRVAQFTLGPLAGFSFENGHF